MKRRPGNIAAVNALLELTPDGLYCPAGDFHIDPWRPVRRAVITHAHADHARPGSRSYLCARDGEGVLRTRLGDKTAIDALAYGAVLTVDSVRLSLHPAGHILGSSQVRIEKGGRICVVSGDTKTAADPTCRPLEPIRCHDYISESTFGLPIFKWPSTAQVLDEIHAWWRENQSQGCTSVLFAYSLGKAQRILAGLDPSTGPIFTHGAVEKINQCYRDAGVVLPATRHVGGVAEKRLFREAMVIAPPSADAPAWMRRFPNRSRGFASGWMRIRGNRRRRVVDRGFVLSDHSDWDGLWATIAASGADHVGITHGYADEMVRCLREKGLGASVVPTRYEGEADASPDAGPDTFPDTHSGEAPGGDDA